MAKAPVSTAARRVSKKVRKNIADGIAHVFAAGFDRSDINSVSLIQKLGTTH